MTRERRARQPAGADGTAARVRLGLVGCGHVGREVHLALLPSLPGAALVAVAEADPARRAAARSLAPHVDTVADYRELLERGDIDAVVICLPTALHGEAAIAALEHGKHVYLEKPLATDLAAARAVLATWRRTGLVASMGFNYRFSPLYQQLRRQVRAGVVGEPVCVRSVFSTAAGAAAPWRRGGRSGGGGVLLDLASHHIDLVRFIFDDEVGEVVATLRSRHSRDDTAVVEMRLRGGLPVQSFFAYRTVEEDRFDVVGEAGTLSVSRCTSLAVQHREPEARRARLGQLRHAGRTLAGLPHLVRKLRAPWHEPSFRLALAHFTGAVADHRRPARPDLEDGFRSLAVVEAADLSAQTGRWVPVAEEEEEVGGEPAAATERAAS